MSKNVVQKDITLTPVKEKDCFDFIKMKLFALKVFDLKCLEHFNSLVCLIYLALSTSQDIMCPVFKLREGDFYPT